MPNVSLYTNVCVTTKGPLITSTDITNVPAQSKKYWPTCVSFFSHARHISAMVNPPQIVSSRLPIPTSIYWLIQVNFMTLSAPTIKNITPTTPNIPNQIHRRNNQKLTTSNIAVGLAMAAIP